MTILRRPPILVLWSAQTLSVLGDRFFALAIMWLALERSGPVTMGLVAIAESLPYIALGAVGRRLAEQFTSFRVLAGVDLVRGGLTVALPWLWATGGTPSMLAAVLALGVAGAVFDPNLGALVPDLVGADEVPAMTAAMDLTGRIARVAGPALAGIVLLAAPTQALFLADAATFAVSAVALFALARTPSRAPGASSDTEVGDESVPAQARELLRQHPALRAALAVHGLGLFVSAIPAIGMPVLLAHHLHDDASAYGLVLAVSGVGALIGNLAASQARLTEKFPSRFCLAWAVTGILLAATGAASTLLWVAVFSALSGVVSPFVSIAMTARLSAFEQPERLRLMQVNFGVMRSCGTAGMAVIPAVIADIPAAGFIGGGTLLAVASAAAWLVSPALAARGTATQTAEMSIATPAAPRPG